MYLIYLSNLSNLSIYLPIYRYKYRDRHSHRYYRLVDIKVARTLQPHEASTNNVIVTLRPDCQGGLEVIRFISI
jgi:hypothetical protein